VTRRGITVYQESGIWWAEYTRLTHWDNVFFVSGGRRYERNETVAWRKWRINGASAVMTRTESRLWTFAYEVYFEDHAESEMDDLAEAYFATLPSVASLFPIHAENGITTWTDGGETYRIEDYQVKRRIPVYDYFIVNNETETVSYSEWLSGLTRVLGAWIQQDGRRLMLRPRMSFPGTIVREITREEIIGGIEISSTDISASDFQFTYLRDAELVVQAVDEVFDDFRNNSIPMAFNWTGVGVDYEVGTFLLFDGWTIMITGVGVDVELNETSLEGVGKR